MSPNRCLTQRMSYNTPMHSTSNESNEPEYSPHRALLLDLSQSLARLAIAPDSIAPDAAKLARVLVTAKLGLPARDERGRVDHEVAFLRVEPGLRILVAIAEDRDARVDGEELDLQWVVRGEG